MDKVLIYRCFGGLPELAREPWMEGVTLLLVASVQYLLVRSRHIRLFGGLNLHSDESWAGLKQSLRTLALRSFAPH